MSSFLKSVIKRIDNKNATIADSGIYSDVTGFINTGTLLLNALFSGSMFKGIPDNKITMVAGPEGVGKSFMLLSIISSFLKEYPEGNAVIFESESAIQSKTLTDFNIDAERVLFVPVSTVQEFRSQSLQILDEYEKLPEAQRKKERMFICLDSLGNLSTSKEMEDSLAGKETMDMTRAKLIKSVFRTISIRLGLLKVPFFCTNHIYMSQSLFPSAIASGGCLMVGEKLRMFDGTLIPIEEVKVGYQVATQAGSGTVAKVWTPETLDDGFPQCYRLFFIDEEKTLSVVNCSEKHKFLLDENWVPAKDVQIEDKLTTKDGTIEVFHKFDLGFNKVYDIEVFPDSNYILENGLICHNSGTKYAASTIVFLSKKKEKEGTLHAGNIVHCKLDKSRFTKEGSQVDLLINFSKGLDPFWGVLDMMIEAGLVKQSGTRYEFPSGEKVFRKVVNANPETYFTPELLNKLDEFLGKKFLYGCVLDNQDLSEESDDSDTL